MTITIHHVEEQTAFWRMRERDDAYLLAVRARYMPGATEAWHYANRRDCEAIVAAVDAERTRRKLAEFGPDSGFTPAQLVAGLTVPATLPEG